MSDRDVGARARTAYQLESALAALAAGLAVLTLAWPDWIEGVFGFDPDHRSGAFEVAIVLGYAAVAVVLALLARRAWRRAAPAPSA